MKEFKKSDLKSGMLVETRSGDVWIVINNQIVSAKGEHIWLMSLSEDLTTENCVKEYDIMKISSVKNDISLVPKNWTLEELEAQLLWQREEKEMIEIDGVEYELDYVNKAIAAQKACGEEPKEEIKPFVIEYDSSCFEFDTQVREGSGEWLEYIDYGCYRKTKQNAEYSLKRNKRANLLEALVEYLQGELGGDYSIYKNDAGKYIVRTGWVDIGGVQMSSSTGDKICEMLTNEEYSLDS